VTERIKIPIAKKLLIYLYAISTAVAAFVTVATSAIDYSKESGELERSAIQLDSITTSAVSALIWNRDLESVATQMKSVLGNPMVWSIIVYDDSANVIFQGTSAGAREPQFSITRSSPVIYSEGGVDKTIGRVEFVMSKDKVVDAVLWRFIAVLLLNGLKAVIVSTLLFFILRRLVTRPVSELLEYFRATPPSEAGAKELSVADRETSYDEISELIENAQTREAALAEHNRASQKRIEETSQALDKTTEQMNKERELAALNARLAQLGELAVGIAHEINNPLTIVNGYVMRSRLEAQKSPIDVAKLGESLNAIERTTMRISKIISGLRAYARDGQHDPFAPARLSALISDALEITQGRLREFDIDLKTEVLWDENQEVDCRATQIAQILVVLVNNAADAIKNLDKRWIEIGGYVEGNDVILTVTDSGNGIPGEIVAKLFDPFFTTKPVGEGTGLGLSVAFGIVKGHSGEIFVNSGCANTQFVVKLPISQSASKAA
jgi:C4-dicarboxylate-specific signal transduction histidine kinase